MNGTKIIWLLAIILLGAAVTLALLPSSNSNSELVLPTLDANVALPKPAAKPTGVPATKDSAAPAPAAPESTTPEPTAPAPATATAPARDPNAVSLGLREVIPNAKVVPGNVVPMKDAKTGEDYLLADSRFAIRGHGTREDPYRVSWECLQSASATYIPRSKKFELPQRIAMLNNKWLRIDGYLLFPLYQKESKELTVAFYQYDGCCIGVPPTAYDSIEVNLQQPARRSGGHLAFTYGQVVGKLIVDPFLVDSFLNGLYVLDEAQLRQDVQPEL